MIIARQSTARTVTVGPILDADGAAVTDAVVGDLKIAKNGATPAALNGSATLTHRNTGHYSLALTTSDLDTVGSAEIVIDDTTNAMPVKEITVIEEAVYDVTFAASAGALATAAALATVDSNVDAILEDTATTIPTTLATIAGYIDTEIAAIKAVTDNIPDSGALTTIATAIDTIDGIVDSILVDTDATIPGLIATAQADLDILTGPDGATLSTAAVAAVNATVDTALADYDGPTKAELDTAESNIRGADSDTLKSLSDQIDGISASASPQLLQNTTIATLSTQTSFTLTAGSADDDAYNGAVAIITDQSTSTQKAFIPISDYVGSTKTITLSTSPAFTITTGDTIDIIAAASDAPTAAAIRAEIDSNSTQLAAILEDTGTTLQGLITDLPADILANLFVDSNWTDMVDDVSAILVDTGTTLPGTLSSISSAITVVDANVDAILVDTGTTLPATLATIAGYLDTEIAAIKAVTDAIPDSGAMTSIATASALATAQADLDTITGSDGVTLATTQGNYAPATAAALATVDTVADAIKAVTDLFVAAHAEPTGAPAANETPIEKLGYVFMALRNKLTVTSSAKTFFDDDGNAEWSKSLSDDGTTYTEAEGA